MIAEETARDYKDPSRRVWIVNHYASAPHKAGGGGRHYFLARSLRELGWATTVFGSTTLHPSGAQAFDESRRVHRKSEDGVDFVWVWSNSYRSGGFMRAVGMVVFTLGLLDPRSTRKETQPDVVIGSTVHLLAAWAGLRLAQRNQASFVYEVRDLWPETLIDLGSIRSTGYVARAMKKLSLSLARKATLVVSPLPGVGKYLDENDIDTPFLWIPNGTGAANPAVGEVAADDSSNPFTFMYLGSHGRANALPTLLKAFDRACEQSPGADFVFRLVGDGPAKDSLRSLAEGLTHGRRISFEERIPRAAVNQRAREADCLVVNLLDRPIYQYGISLNKISDYLFAERPIIIASSALNNPVMEAGAGLSVAADDVNALANAMVKTFRMEPTERAAMGHRGREYVLQEYSYQSLAVKLAGALERLP